MSLMGSPDRSRNALNPLEAAFTFPVMKEKWNACKLTSNVHRNCTVDMRDYKQEFFYFQIPKLK